MTHLHEYSERLTHSSNSTEQFPHRLPLLLNCAFAHLLAKRIINRAAHDVVSHDHRSTTSRSTSQPPAFAPQPTQAGISSQTHYASQSDLFSRDGTCARAVCSSLLSYPSYLLTCLTPLNSTLVRFVCLYVCRKILVVRSLRSGRNRRCERRAGFVERENAGVDIVHHAYAVRASPPCTVLIPLSSSQ